jgi:small subunit ribosomal protein S17
MSMEAGKPGPGAPPEVRKPADREAGESDRKAGAPGRKTVIGLVHSAKMQKSRTIRVVRMERHAKYGKFVRRRTTYYAHDESEVSHEGDTVLITETRPLSRTKRWRVVKVLTQGHGGVEPGLADEIALGVGGAVGVLPEVPEVRHEVPEGGAET